MEQMTIKGIAGLAGVSRSTVSRVLNNHPNVRPVVRERVQRVISEHKYVPRAAARSLVTSRSRLIGLLVPRSTEVLFTDPLYPAISRSIVNVAKARGYFAMIPLVTREMEPEFVEHILHGRHFDGIVSANSDVDDPVLPALIKNATPVVRLGRHPYLDNVSWVDADNRSGGYQATLHLLRLGHQRIATITGPLGEISAIDRCDGYKQALMENGVAVRATLIEQGDWTRESGHAAMRRLLAVAGCPTAVFVANDLMALGAMQALAGQGLRIPDDMALVGFDDLPAAASITPALTTVRQSVADIGRVIAEVLLAQIEGRQATPVHTILPTELIVRASCGAAASDASVPAAAP